MGSSEVDSRACVDCFYALVYKLEYGGQVDWAEVVMLLSWVITFLSMVACKFWIVGVGLLFCL